MLLSTFLRYPRRELVIISRVAIPWVQSARFCSEFSAMEVPWHVKFHERRGKNIPQPSMIEIQVVGTGAGGTPKSVMINMDHFKYLFNCGEGTQRIATEHRMRISKIDQVFITHNSWNNIGGLLGMALSLEAMNSPQINIHGPPNIEKLVTMSRGFAQMRTIKNEKYNISAEYFEDSAMRILYVPIYPNGSKRHSPLPVDQADDEASLSQNDTDMSVAYICKPHPKPPALSLEKCVDLGVPRGPLFGKLKSGEAITLENGTVINPEDVTASFEPEGDFIILECPDVSYLESLLANEEFAKLQTSGMTEVVVHLTPPHVMEDPRYKEWLDRFGDDTHHLIVNESGPEVSFEGVYILQSKLHLLHPTVFPLLYHQVSPHTTDKPVAGCQRSNLTIGQTGLIYICRGGKSVKKGTQLDNCFTLDGERDLEEVKNNEEFQHVLVETKAKIEEMGKLPQDYNSQLYPRQLTAVSQTIHRNTTDSCIPDN